MNDPLRDLFAFLACRTRLKRLEEDRRAVAAADLEHRDAAGNAQTAGRRHALERDVELRAVRRDQEIARFHRGIERTADRRFGRGRAAVDRDDLHDTMAVRLARQHIQELAA